MSSLDPMQVPDAKVRPPESQRLAGPRTWFKRRRLPMLLLMVCFSLWIATPATLQLFHISTGETQDNHPLAPAPHWPKSVSQWQELPRQLDAFVKDNFGLRAPLIHINGLLRFKMGLSSSDSVAVGKGNFVYFLDPPDHLIQQHMGQAVFTPETLDQWLKAIEADREWLAKRGIAFYVVIAPDKSTIYPEDLPEYPPLPHSTTRLDQIAARLHDFPDINLVDPRAAIIDAKKTHRVYPYGDSHWGPRAAFIAYKMLMDRIREHFPKASAVELSDYAITREMTPGDLFVYLDLYWDILYPEDRFTWKGNSHLLQTTQLPEAKNWGWLVKMMKTDRQDQPTALIQGDSFTDYVMGPLFLYQTFRDPVYTHHNGTRLNEDLINATHPDIVILQLGERYLEIPP